MAMRTIPGVNTLCRSDLAVMHPFHEKYHTPRSQLRFAHFLASIPLWLLLCLCGIVVLYPMLAFAQLGVERGEPFQVLLRWIPLLLKSGFALNLIISFWSMALGTIAGLFLGIARISRIAPIRVLTSLTMQSFRNSPWLVILYIVVFSIPNEVSLLGQPIAFPEWAKAALAFSLPIMANVSEIVRGAIQSLPTAQWEAAEALAMSRRQALWRIILPQCVKRMIPPWMNWYAILTMATPLVSLVGVSDLVANTRYALSAESDRPELLFPFFGFCLLTFFVYCYPIARLTIHLEKRFATMS
jgi:polar amino acid transport system permease protein